MLSRIHSRHCPRIVVLVFIAMVVAVVHASAPIAYAATLNFSAAVNYTDGSGPSSIATADFNGDGKLDLAIANYNDNNVSVLLGDGAGSFAAAVNYGVGANPSSLAVGDFNGDGKPDLAIANYNGNNVSVLLNDGTGIFAAASNFSVGTNPSSVAVGDLNGDGKVDLVVANYGGGNVSVLLGDGTGSFAAAVNYGAGTNPSVVAVGDFNNDSKLDLAVANYSSNNVSVLMGDGAGGFAGAVNYGVGTEPRAVAVGDFDNDGKLDLAVGNFTSSNVSVLLNGGSGTFATAVNYGVGVQVRSVAVSDFNGDGKLDLMTADMGNDNVAVRLNNGDGTFAFLAYYSAGSNPYSVAVGDFNGDSKPDAAVANFGSGNVSVLLNTTLYDTTTTLTSSPNPSTVGQSVFLTATVSSNTGSPTGTVQFYADGSTLGSPVTLTSGQASITTTALGSGTHPIIATYSGDSNYNGSSSPTVNQVVNCPNTVTVTNNADSGAGSLRQAMADLCANGTIHFNGDYTITLASTLIIAKNLTIDGETHQDAVSGNNAVRVFTVNGSVVANLQNLTIANGTCSGCNGGGIMNNGALTLTNALISNNNADYGGGIMNNGTLSLTNSTIANNSASFGGGIFHNASTTLTINNSTLSSNSAAGRGGAIHFSSGTLEMTNSTLSNNSSYEAGAIMNYATSHVTNSTFSGNNGYYGGGIYNAFTLTLTNSTFANNTATGSGAALFMNNGIMTMTNSTIAYNSSSNVAGIHFYNSTATAKNTIIANNTTGQNCSGTFEPASANNLSNDPSCSGGFTQSSTILDSSLGNHGGSTQTIALLVNSPAIDEGDAASCPPQDQRGRARDDLRCDIGAYEYTFTDGNRVQETNLAQGIPYTFGPTLGKITRDTVDDPGTLTFVKIPAWSTQPSNAITRLWDLSATGSAYNLTLGLCFTETERNNLTPSQLKLYRYNGSSWENKGGTLDTSHPNITCVWTSGITALSRWTLATGNPAGAPTAVTVMSFVAKPDPAGITLEWKTVLEKNTRLFQMERSLDDKTYAALGGPIPSIGAGIYTVRDSSLHSGQTAYYRLIEIMLDGTRTEYGPIASAITSPLFLPLIRR